MMEFFEFFFTGEGWGWTLIGLFVLISVIGHYIVEMLDVYFTYRLGAKLGIDFDKLTEDDDNDNSATIDDCR